MFNKNSLFFFILLFPYFASCEEPKISNYKKYKDTSTQFRLEQLNVTLEHPWAVSFIKDNELIVTEKGGSVFPEWVGDLIICSLNGESFRYTNPH